MVVYTKKKMKVQTNITFLFFCEREKKREQRKTQDRICFFWYLIIFSLFLSFTKKQKDSFKKNNKKEIVARTSFLQKTFVKNWLYRQKRKCDSKPFSFILFL
jgi:hypothetical protein